MQILDTSTPATKPWVAAKTIHLARREDAQIPTARTDGTPHAEKRATFHSWHTLAPKKPFLKASCL